MGLTKPGFKENNPNKCNLTISPAGRIRPVSIFPPFSHPFALWLLSRDLRSSLGLTLLVRIALPQDILRFQRSLSSLNARPYKSHTTSTEQDRQIKSTIKIPFFSFLFEIEYCTHNRKGKMTSMWGGIHGTTDPTNKGKEYSGPQKEPRQEEEGDERDHRNPEWA